MKTTVTRHHDFCAGHRVYGHENKCSHLHGHNYRVYFTCAAENGQLDNVGRVVDFSVIKERLCQWLEDNWDHRMLLWREDPLKVLSSVSDVSGLVFVPFNPTAENMAAYLITVIGPRQLEGAGIKLVKCLIEETTKCSTTVELE